MQETAVRVAENVFNRTSLGVKAKDKVLQRTASYRPVGTVEVKLWRCMQVTNQLRTLAVLTRCPLQRRLCGLQNRSGHSSGENNPAGAWNGSTVF